MRFILLALVLSLSIGPHVYAQTSTSTGRTKIDEKDFNVQLEKCKLDTNNSPVSVTSKKPSTSSSSKAKAQ